MDPPPSPASCLIYGLRQANRGDTQVFALGLREAEVSEIGGVQTRMDLEGIAVDPVTRALYAVSGQQGRPRTTLFKIDARTGAHSEVGPLGVEQPRGLAFRASDATLWAWSTEGLIEIDTSTGEGTLRLEADVTLDHLAWTIDGARLLGVRNRRLWVVDPEAGTVRTSRSTFPGGPPAWPCGPMASFWLPSTPWITLTPSSSSFSTC
ncbi:MAG: hypothetical protein HYY06_10845 [Deltaproteobacteria bacterium]|nr:hypothetical protein [Deltaproteobacteria bacterium]